MAVRTTLAWRPVLSAARPHRDRAPGIGAAAPTLGADVVLAVPVAVDAERELDSHEGFSWTGDGRGSPAEDRPNPHGLQDEAPALWGVRPTPVRPVVGPPPGGYPLRRGRPT